MEVSVWGVRGGIASAAPETVEHGGNTPCVSVVSGTEKHGAEGHGTETHLILDAGTGLRKLGNSLMEQAARRGEEGPSKRPIKLDILLSHFHWDHIQGLPFFAPLWDGRFEIDIHSCAPAAETERCVQLQFAAPYFPQPLHSARARIGFHQLCGPQRIADVQVTPFPQSHPQGSSGFRLEADGAVLVYATDTEGGHREMESTLLHHAQGASLLILDAQYTSQELASRTGWGHGDWRRACSIAGEAAAGQLLLFHHDPGRSDAELRRIEAQAQTEFRQTAAAREGMRFVLEKRGHFRRSL